MTAPKWLQDSLTAADGISYDVMRIAYAVGALALILFTGYDVIGLHHAFNAMEFCGGFATLTGGTAAGLAAKQLSGAEPAVKTSQTGNS